MTHGPRASNRVVRHVPTPSPRCSLACCGMTSRPTGSGSRSTARAAVADNVRAFLSLTRYASATTSPKRRCAGSGRIVAEAPRRSSRSATTSRTSKPTTREDETGASAFHVRPAGRCVCERRIRHRARRARRALREVIGQQIEARPAADHTAYERVKARAAARREERRLSRRAPGTARTRHRPGARGPRRRSRATGKRYSTARSRSRRTRSTTLDAPDAAHAEGDPYTPNLRRTQYTLDDSQYFSSVTVRPGDREALTVPVTVAAASRTSIATPSAWVTARTPTCAANSPGTTAA